VIKNIYKGRKILWPQRKIEEAMLSYVVGYRDGLKFSYLDVVEHRETKRRFLIHGMYLAVDIDSNKACTVYHNEAEDYDLIAYFNFEKNKFEYIKELSIEDQVKIETREIW
jgi:hypothetical protein